MAFLYNFLLFFSITGQAFSTLKQTEFSDYEDLVKT